MEHQKSVNMTTSNNEQNSEHSQLLKLGKRYGTRSSSQQQGAGVTRSGTQSAQKSVLPSVEQAARRECAPAPKDSAQIARTNVQQTARRGREPTSIGSAHRHPRTASRELAPVSSRRRAGSSHQRPADGEQGARTSVQQTASRELAPASRRQRAGNSHQRPADSEQGTRTIVQQTASRESIGHRYEHSDSLSLRQQAQSSHCGSRRSFFTVLGCVCVCWPRLTHEKHAAVRSYRNR